MNKIALALGLSLALTGCVTMSGTYELNAFDSSGKQLTSNMRLTAEGSRIYSVRNGLCMTYPKATIIMKDVKTGAELQGESPYQCR
ncbi:MAG: hypothetical protein ACO1NO_09840 [Burkholderiaceae bacterium]